MVLSAPLVTRLYSPSDVGLIGVFMAFVEFAVAGLALRYDLGIISARSEAEGDCLLATSLYLTLATSALASLLMHGFIRGGVLSFGELPSWSPFLAFLALIFSGGHQSVRYWLVSRGAYPALSRGLAAQGAGRALVPVALGPAGLGWVGLLAGELAGRLLGIGVILGTHAGALRRACRVPPPRLRRAVLSRHRKLPAVVLPSTLVEAIGASILTPLIAWNFGAGPAGEFVLVSRMSWIPVGFIAASFADVFHARAAGAYGSDPASVRVILRAMSLRLGIIALLVFVPIMVIAPLVAGPLFGREWARAGILMSVLAPFSMSALVVGPASRLLLVVNRSEFKLIVDLVRLVVPVGVLLGLRRLEWSFVPTVAVLGATLTLSYVLYFILIWRACGVKSRP